MFVCSHQRGEHTVVSLTTSGRHLGVAVWQERGRGMFIACVASNCLRGWLVLWALLVSFFSRPLMLWLLTPAYLMTSFSVRLIFSYIGVLQVISQAIMSHTSLACLCWKTDYICDYLLWMIHSLTCISQAHARFIRIPYSIMFIFIFILCCGIYFVMIPFNIIGKGSLKYLQSMFSKMPWKNCRYTHQNRFSRCKTLLHTNGIFVAIILKF